MLLRGLGALVLLAACAAPAACVTYQTRVTVREVAAVTAYARPAIPGAPWVAMPPEGSQRVTVWRNDATGDELFLSRTPGMVLLECRDCPANTALPLVGPRGIELNRAARDRLRWRPGAPSEWVVLGSYNATFVRRASMPVHYAVSTPWYNVVEVRERRDASILAGIVAGTAAGVIGSGIYGMATSGGGSNLVLPVAVTIAGVALLVPMVPFLVPSDRVIYRERAASERRGQRDPERPRRAQTPAPPGQPLLR